jgi:hypothetical protein
MGCIPTPKTKINAVIGKKMDFPKIDKPTKQEINHFHEIYI